MAKDLYSNFAYGHVLETVAGTLAFGEIKSGVAIFEKIAWLISRIEYYVALTYVNYILAESDEIQMGLVSQNNITSMDFSTPTVIDWMAIRNWKFGTPASADLYFMPLVKDFTGLPSGGILIPPSPLYLATQGISLANPVAIDARIYFTYISLKPDEYWELVESRRIVA